MKNTKVSVFSMLRNKIKEIANNTVWVVKKVPLFAEGVNDNYFEFMHDDIEKNYKTMEGKPVVTNLTGIDSTDHATSSSLDTVGHVYNVHKEEDEDGKLVVFGDLEITNPIVGEKLKRHDTHGNPELNGVSMGVNTESRCSICGAPMNGYSCENGHIRGEVYDGKVCTAQSGNSEFEHLALTTIPAERKSYFNADQVFLVTAVYEKGGKMKKKKEKAQETKVEVTPPLEEEIKPELVSDETKKKSQDEIILELQRTVAEQAKEIEELKTKIEELLPKKEEVEPEPEPEETAELNDKKSTPEEKKMPGDESNVPESKPKPILKDTTINDNIAQVDGTGDTKPIMKKATAVATEIAKLKRENNILRARLKLKEKGEIRALQKELASMNIDYSSNDLRALRVAVKVAKQARKNKVVSRKEKYFGKKLIIPKHSLDAAKQHSNIENANKKIEEKGAAFALKEAFERGKRKR